MEHLSDENDTQFHSLSMDACNEGFPFQVNFSVLNYNINISFVWLVLRKFKVLMDYPEYKSNK